MRSTPTGNATLLKIQQEINEVAQRENELRSVHENINGDTTNPRLLQRTTSTPAIPTSNGVNTRRYIPNTNTKGVMQKFFKMRGKINTVTALNNSIQPEPKSAWLPPLEVVTTPPSKALIPQDKPLRKGFIPIQDRIKSELRELKNREDELRSERRKSQPDLMAALSIEEDENISRSPSPTIGKLRPARSLSHLLDEEYSLEINSAPSSLKPARSLAQLCDAADEEIESPKSLIQQWESRIREAQRQV